MGKTTKYTYEQAYEKFKEKGYTLIDTEYKNSKTKMSCIDNLGYKYFVSLDNISNTQCGFHIVHMANKYAIENIRTYIKNNHIVCALLSNEYNSNTSKLKFLCGECGQEFEMGWSELYERKKYTCTKCSTKRAHDASKHDFGYVVDSFLEYGYTVLSKNYVNDRSKLEIIDCDGYKYSKAYQNLRNIMKSNGKFEIVATDNPYSIHNINNYIKTNSLTCKLLSTIYEANNKKLLFICGACGNNFETSWASLTNKSKTTCTSCSSKKQHDMQKHSYEYIKEFISKNGNVLLSSEYINQYQELEIECVCGNIFSKSFNTYKNSKSKRMCEYCYNDAILKNNKLKSISKYFKGVFCPCDHCSKDCNGISICNIYRYFRMNKIPLIKQESIWSGEEYVDIVDFAYNNESTILDDSIDILNDKTMDDLIELINTVLPLANAKIDIKKQCSCCGKTVLRKKHMYYSKYCYCSKECKDNQSIIMMNNGDIKFTRTTPHIKICEILDSLNYMYTEEYLLKYQSIDIYSEEHDMYIEVMGDYWHGNPNKYKYNELNKKQLYDITKDRTKYSYMKKYIHKNILYLWEIDIDENLLLCEKLIQLYISKNGDLQDYQSFNYFIDDVGNLKLKNNKVNPYFVDYKKLN